MGHAIGEFLSNRQNNTLVLGNTKFISRVEQDILFVHFGHWWDMVTGEYFGHWWVLERMQFSKSEYAMQNIYPA